MTVLECFCHLSSIVRDIIFRQLSVVSYTLLTILEKRHLSVAYYRTIMSCLYSLKKPYIERIFGCFMKSWSLISSIICYYICSSLTCSMSTIFSATTKPVFRSCATYTLPKRPFPIFFPTLKSAKQGSRRLGATFYLHWSKHVFL